MILLVSPVRRQPHRRLSAELYSSDAMPQARHGVEGRRDWPERLRFGICGIGFTHLYYRLMSVVPCSSTTCDNICRVSCHGSEPT